MGAGVADDERLARRHDLANFRVLGELDGQVAQVLVVAGRHDVPEVALVAHEHDAAALDLRPLGDAANDGEKDVAKVEARREGLRQLEHDLRVALPALERVEVLADPKLPADACDDFGGPYGLANEVVGTGSEGPRRLVVPFEAGHDDHRNVAQGRPCLDRAQDRVAVRVRHQEVDDDERSHLPREPLERFGAGSDPDAGEIRRFEGFAEDVAGNAVVVDNQDGRALRHNPQFSA